MLSVSLFLGKYILVVHLELQLPFTIRCSLCTLCSLCKTASIFLLIRSLSPLENHSILCLSIFKTSCWLKICKVYSMFPFFPPRNLILALPLRHNLQLSDALFYLLHISAAFTLLHGTWETKCCLLEFLTFFLFTEFNGYGLFTT